MLRTLLAKDLRRAWRNPVPWLVSLVVPFLITALIGAMFGPKSSGGGLGEVRIALVDEDETALTEFLRGSLEQMRTAESKEEQKIKLNAVFLERDEAMRRIGAGELAAVVVVPAGFTDGFLSDDGTTSLELVKNPAQAIHPRVVEETLGLLVTTMNAFRHLAGDMVGDVRALVDSDSSGLEKMAAGGSLLLEARDRFEPVKEYLSPPLVTYEEEARADTSAKGPSWSVFSYVLAGMTAMFLLYLADNAMRDLYREGRFRTLERFKTLREGLLVFIGGKIVFAVAVTLIGALILCGGGALVFQFAWHRPLELLALVLAYAFFASGFMGLLGALAGRERRADVLSNVIIMGMAMLGGCMFPVETFPAFLRSWVTPWMPTGWFASAMRALQDGGASASWLVAAGKLVLVGLAATLVASALFRRRMEKGVPA